MSAVARNSDPSPRWSRPVSRPVQPARRCGSLDDDAPWGGPAWLTVYADEHEEGGAEELLLEPEPRQLDLAVFQGGARARG
ncbi:hypothetical protein V4F39_11460 [Aquincola sp. MAHUQ-54]|uniref:Uncharacterized protein n=1 Tax=Aquincola agrisoli TaxID=3119538 RepID=A0AAW9QCL4_9BURK